MIFDHRKACVNTEPLMPLESGIKMGFIGDFTFEWTPVIQEFFG